MSSETLRFLVTGSSLFFSARLVHDLGRRGVQITAADSHRFSAGKASRHVSRRLKLPVLSKDPGGYLDALITELRTNQYDLLLPTFEEALLLGEYESELRPYTRLVLPAFTDMYRLHHKPSLHKLCLSLGLPTPPTLVVDSPDQLNTVSALLGFPVVVKLAAGNNSVGRTYCDDDTQLRQAFNRQSAEQQSVGLEPPFVQKKIKGDLICTLCFCSNGRKLGEVVYRTLRMFPQAGGTSVHRQSIVHNEISLLADQIVAATNWSGFLGLDFLVEHETGIPYIIDANTRANPAIHLGFCAGLDWTQLIVDVAKDRSPSVQVARPGVNVHTMLLDFAWLFEGLLPRGGGLLRFPRRCREFLRPAWNVDSRGDLLSTGEIAPVAILAMQTFFAGIMSLITGHQSGHLMLEHANYDAAAATKLRSQRPIEFGDRSADAETRAATDLVPVSSDWSNAVHALAES